MSRHAPFSKDGLSSDYKHRNAEREADSTADHNCFRIGRLIRRPVVQDVETQYQQSDR
jgi:hypothetical protein